MINVYVGNLSYSATDADLEKAFSAFGAITRAKVVTDRDSGRSRGFGFVEMADDEQARAAITALNGSDMEGRKLVVNEARAKQ